VVLASYDLVLVDEYQDCGLDQHEIVLALSRLVPTIVFGDPMQSIFEMGGQRVVKWTVDVLPTFPAIDQLSTPWRWRNQNNDALAMWLCKVREKLEEGGSLQLTDTPACVRIHHVKSPSMAPALERKACYFKSLSPTNRLVIIGSKASEESRAALAKRVHAQNVETIECKRLHAICLKIDETSGLVRLRHLIEFLDKCSVGVKPVTFLRRIEAIHSGKKKPRAITSRESAALNVIRQDGLDVILSLLDEFRQGGQIFRSELLYALRDSLLAKLASCMSLSECAWHVQERRRHAGRRHGYKIVASTLLVKGLEYENAVVFFSKSMTKEDVYVALTRASLKLEIVTDTLEYLPA
jgi:DNA helicase-2/ATP-dependent DNA helicase PcrA